MFAPKTIVSMIDMTMKTNKRNTKVIIVYNHKAMKSIIMCHSVYHIVMFLNNVPSMTQKRLRIIVYEMIC